MKVADPALFSWSNALILFKFFKKWNFRRNMGIVQTHWTEKWIFQLSILSQRCQELELFYPPFLLQTPPQLTTKFYEPIFTNQYLYHDRLSQIIQISFGLHGSFCCFRKSHTKAFLFGNSLLTLTSHPFWAFQVKYAAGCNSCEQEQKTPVTFHHTHWLINRDSYNGFL